LEAKCESVDVRAVVMGGTLNELRRFRDNELWGFRNNGVLGLWGQAYVNLVSMVFYWVWQNVTYGEGASWDVQ